MFHDGFVTPAYRRQARTLKIDLSTVGAALCGRPIEKPTKGLPYIY